MQPVTVITQPQVLSEDKLRPASVTMLRWLSIIQVVMGGLCVVFGIILRVIDRDDSRQGHDVSIIGYGIWIGLFFALVGALGIAAAGKNTSGFIMTAMIMNILCSSLFILPLISFTSIGLAITSVNKCSYYSSWFYFCEDQTITKTFEALDALMLLMAFAELVITIWSAAVCCGAVCRCCKQQQIGHVVQYNTGLQTHYPAGQMVMVQNTPVAYASTTYTVGQPSIASYSYPTAVHQPVAGGHMTQPQGPPTYTQPQTSSGYQPPPVAYPQTVQGGALPAYPPPAQEGATSAYPPAAEGYPVKQ